MADLIYLIFLERLFIAYALLAPWSPTKPSPSLFFHSLDVELR